MRKTICAYRRNDMYDKAEMYITLFKMKYNYYFTY